MYGWRRRLKKICADCGTDIAGYKQESEVTYVYKKNRRIIMGETYRGYQITIAWNSETTGYDFIITPPDNGKIITSEDSYFYDYNAVKAAKVKIDELFK